MIEWPSVKNDFHIFAHNIGKCFGTEESNAMEISKIKRKSLSLEKDRVRHDRGNLTTNQGVSVPNTDDSLKAGTRGPTLMEDFIPGEDHPL